MEAIRGVTIFYCYSTEDEKHLRKIEAHLGDLKRLGKVTTWYDRQIAPGIEWEREINAHLNAADIILLLVSADFMASDYCYNVEMKRALQRHQSAEATDVIPIIVSPVNWHDTPMGKLQAWPTKGKAITTWANREEAYQDVAKGIKKRVKVQLARQWRDEGRSYYLAGFYEEASQAYEEALRLSPESADLYRDKGHTLLKLNHYNEALDAYDKATQLRPDNEHFYIDKGHAFLKMGRLAEALITYDHAIRINPNNACSYIHKGHVLLDLQRSNAALDAFEQALQHDPTNSKAYVGKGRALDALGKISEALQAYAQAEKVNSVI